MSDATTYAPEIKDLGEKIVSLTLGKAVELADYLEKVHNIKPAAGGAVVMAAAGGAAAGAEAAPAKTEFTVVLDGIIAADKKISIIKVVREITGLGLKEAKDLVEGAPKNVKENIAKDEAETVKKKLEDAGAKVSLK
ncbi:MAG: 50S ribosomal protein L7/L12 [Gemmataceae bacterium]|nr:50S ribosomal protein L7/L12 [Gemmataceae bacterium]MBJ7343756.1 50S ribosomal protein L7/L12 [Gemmataceae bacterium]MBJ7431287.1 50S ribosomal protein L7/L12 [Gemmataceae bacterium]MBJ7497121.1 50S ribosomal protein L7/L12 [Gemmataceae bacterium]MBY0327083.1 50S ribosomal protein L7/L12 [Gemmataceae bacterium]